MQILMRDGLLRDYFGTAHEEKYRISYSVYIKDIISKRASYFNL